MTITRTRRLIRGVHLWDGLAASRSAERRTIVVEDGRIRAIETEGGIPDDTGLEVFSYESDATALPGLIDSHVHLALDPAIFSASQQLAVPPERIWAGMQQRALAMVQAGVTTARDLGAGRWMEIELRDRIAAGEIAGPRLVCAGQPLTSPGGHCHFWGGEARGSDAVRQVIDRQLAHRADWIKVMATGGVFTQGTDIAKPQYDEAELREIVEHARRGGRAVAAHCHGTAGIRNAVAAGVRTVEHCSFAGGDGFGSDFDASLVPDLARDGVWVSPTVNLGWRRRAEKDGEPTPFWESMSTCLRALRTGGVRLIASTDAGIPGVAHHQLPEALATFARYADLTCVEALRTATSEAAVALGLDGETGSLRPGLAADVLVVEGDPTLDLSALQRPKLVLARGRVAYRADWDRARAS